MSAVQVNAAVVDKSTILSAGELITGKTVKMKAIPGGKYLLSEGKNGVAPENITLKRAGQDLYIFLEGSALENPELIISGFYHHSGELAGKGEDGLWHEYAATSGIEQDQTASLADGEMTSVGLSAEDYQGAEGLNNLSAASGALSPALLALGVLGALAAATGLVMMAGKKGGGSDDKNPDDSTAIPASVAIESVHDAQGNVILPGEGSAERAPIFSGSGQPGNKISIYDNGKVIGEVTIGADGKWVWTPPSPLEGGVHQIVLVEHDPSTGATGLPLPGFELVIIDAAAARSAEDIEAPLMAFGASGVELLLPESLLASPDSTAPGLHFGDILSGQEADVFIHDDMFQMTEKGHEESLVSLEAMLNVTAPHDWVQATGEVQNAGVQYDVSAHKTEDSASLIQEGNNYDY